VAPATFLPCTLSAKQQLVSHFNNFYAAFYRQLIALYDIETNRHIILLKKSPRYNNLCSSTVKNLGYKDAASFVVYAIFVDIYKQLL